MRIAFVGKGGSGKTTTSALFSRYIAGQRLPVLAFDADINQHLGVALGADESTVKQIPAMGYNLDEIKEYFRGDNDKIETLSDFLKTTPPARGSNLMHLRDDNEIMRKFSHDIDGVQLMVSGQYDEQDVGLRCFHGKQGSVEIVLTHLVDSPDEYVIADLTAGADSFSSGLFLKFDVTVLVVEPTIKGVSVWQQYKTYAREHNLTIKVIANKVEDDDDIQFVKDRVGDDFLLALPKSKFVRSIDRGEHLPIDQLEPANLEGFEKLKTFVDSVEQDWSRMYERSSYIHRRKALTEPNDDKKQRLLSQIDAEFHYVPTQKRIAHEADIST